ncbi:MAG: hypothetical protein V8Q42_09895 [Anaerovoracaceae bacterium]
MSGKVFDSETNQYVSEDEFFEAITEKLIENIKTKKQQNYCRFMMRTKTFRRDPLIIGQRKLMGLTAKEYLLQKGVMVESVKGLSDDQVKS